MTNKFNQTEILFFNIRIHSVYSTIRTSYVPLPGKLSTAFMK